MVVGVDIGVREDIVEGIWECGHVVRMDELSRFGVHIGHHGLSHVQYQCHTVKILEMLQITHEIIINERMKATKCSRKVFLTSLN